MLARAHQPGEQRGIAGRDGRRVHPDVGGRAVAGGCGFGLGPAAEQSRHGDQGGQGPLARHRPEDEALALGLPQEGRGSLAPGHFGHGVRRQLRHLGRGADFRQGPGEVEQGPGRGVRSAGVLEGGDEVEGGGGIVRVQREDLPLALHEAHAGREDGGQPAVEAPGRGDVDDEVGAPGVVGDRSPEFVGQGLGLGRVEPVVVEVDRLVGPGAHDQEVAGGVDGVGGPLGDAGEQVVEVVAGQQLGRGGEDLLEALAHVAQLGLEQGHPGVGVDLHRRPGLDHPVVCPGRRGAAAPVDDGRPLTDLPGHRVETEPPTAGLALGLGHHPGEQAEEDRHVGEQALGEIAHIEVAGMVGPGEGPHHGVGLADLERLDGRDGGEGGRGRGDVAQELGRGAERAPPVGDVGALVLAKHLFADVATDVGVADHHGGRPSRATAWSWVLQPSGSSTTARGRTSLARASICLTPFSPERPRT